MKSDQIDDARERRRTQLCEALGLDPAETLDVVVNRRERRIELRTAAKIDLNDYRWYSLEANSFPVVGLSIGDHISLEQWEKAVEIDDEWQALFLAWRVEWHAVPGR